MLERILKYFAECISPSTSSTSQVASNKRLDILSHCKLDPCFMWAVVYPIYYEPDPKVKGLPTIDDLASQILQKCDLEDLDWHGSYEYTQERKRELKCSDCGKKSENLKKCTHCHIVQYILQQRLPIETLEATQSLLQRRSKSEFPWVFCLLSHDQKWTQISDKRGNVATVLDPQASCRECLSLWHCILL